MTAKTYQRRSMLAILSAGALLLTACDEGGKKIAAKPPRAPHVVVTPVVERTVPIIMEFSGTLKAVKSVDIIPRVSGYVKERNFEEGSFVKKGAHLYLIDPRQFKDALDGYQAQIKYDRASLTFWKSEVKRFNALLKRGNVSREKAEDAVSKEREKAALVEKARANIESAKLDLEFCKITAPFDGRIGQTRVNIGAVVTEQKDVMVTVVQIDPIYVEFNISRAQLFEITEIINSGRGGGESILGLPAEVILPHGGAYGTRGKIDFISSQIDPNTDTITARAVFTNQTVGKAGMMLIPGQYAPVRIFVGRIPNALLVPNEAITETQAGKHVFVVGADGKVAQRNVATGSSFDSQRHITKGLKKGERVVVEGLQKVRPGMAVKAMLKTAKPS